MHSASHDSCPLCDGGDVLEFLQDSRRQYLQCRACQLVFVPAAQFLTPQQEKAEYDLHQNEADDPGYRRFLSRLFLPMEPRLKPASQGLDFGSGPGPTLSLMFEETGHSVALYDPFYARQPAVLETAYDFITATEVVEHLHQPGRELERLWRILKPGGHLGIMTKLVLDRQAFARWHYKNDLTHVCFYSRGTFEWLAARWQAEIDFVAKDAIILRKR